MAVVQSFRLKIIGRLINEKPLILLTLIYFLFRLSNLTRLPIFNDESIYLHWSQIITKTHHYFYPALFDGKQPLPIWLFSLAGFFSSNLFLAGRLTVVLIGLGTTIGVFLTARRIFDRKIAFWLALIYLLVPYVFFFERMALMEGMLNFIAIWSFYLTFCLLEKPRTKLAIILGVILGVGMWIKSSSIFFVFLAFLSLLAGYLFKKKNRRYLIVTVYSLIIFLFVFVPLFLHSSYRLIAQKDLEFRLSTGELLSFPLNLWLRNLRFYSSWLLFYATPFLLISGLLGLRKNYLALWFFLPFLAAIFLSRQPNSRYIVLMTPFLVLLAGEAFRFLEKRKPFFIVVFVLVVIPCLFYDLIQLIKPEKFFNCFPPNQAILVDKSQYITNWTSGYGVEPVVEYLNRASKEEKILVGVRLDSGNPESAIFVYLLKNPNLEIFYYPLDKPSIELLTSAEFQYKAFIVTRDNQLGGMDNYLEEINKFYKPESKNYVGLYQVKKIE